MTTVEKSLAYVCQSERDALREGSVGLYHAFTQITYAKKPLWWMQELEAVSIVSIMTRA